jgi:hypothetical protein
MGLFYGEDNMCVYRWNFYAGLLLCYLLIDSFRVFAFDVAPYSDPNNYGGWTLNTSISDEFEGQVVDPTKWFVQGSEQTFYIWKGRAPSQFAPHNVLLKDGLLRIRTQWEPDYDFVGIPPKKQEVSQYENITTGAIISHHNFLYGYMEIKAKIPDGAMTGGFWGTGHQQELDVFELIGRVKTGSRHPESTFITSIHDWRPGHPSKNKVWKYPYKMAERAADGFHVYGVEWNSYGLSMYLDGELLYQASRFEIGDAWVLNNPLEIWLDSEVFPWHGIPEKHELPIYFDVDYVRIWQKETRNLLAQHYFDFEGPYLTYIYYKPRPRRLFEQHWQIDDKSADFFSITEDRHFQFSKGRKSLKFQRHKASKFNAAHITSAKNSVNLSQGKYRLLFDIRVAPPSKLYSINLLVGNQSIKVEIGDVPTNSWTGIRHEFEVSSAIVESQLILSVAQENFGTQEQLWFIDNIRIEKE